MRRGPVPFILAAVLFAVLAAIQLRFFVRGTDAPDWFLFGTDTVSHDMPVMKWIGERIAAEPGRMPLWMPPLQGGLPTLGAFLFTPFSPFVWLHWKMPFPAAQVIGWGLALWWAGLGGYVAARAMGMRAMAAVVAGAAWMLTGHIVTLIHAGHWQKVMAISWLAWGFAGSWLAMRRKCSRRLAGCALGGLALGMMLLAGHPQIAAAHLMMAAGIALMRTVRARSGRTALACAGAIAATCVIGFAVGGAQLLPGMEMGRVSNRAQGVSFEEAAETSYPPLESFEFIAPRFLGSNSFSDRDYYGSWGTERIVSDYAGLVFVAFAAFGALSRRKRATTAFLLGASIFALVLGFGKFTPLYRICYAVVPGFDSFRSPATFYCIVSLCVALLAGLGVREEMSNRPGTSWKAPTIAFALAAFVGIALFLRWRVWPKGLPDSDMHATIYRLGAALLTLLLAHLASEKFPRGFANAAAILVIVGVGSYDLLSANGKFLMAQPYGAYETKLGDDQLDALYFNLKKPWRPLYVGRELSLRPMLIGAESLNGYHPISFAAKESLDKSLALNSDAWKRHWGVGMEVLPGTGGRVGSGGMTDEGRRPYNLFVNISPVRLLDPPRDYTIEGLAWNWKRRDPNRWELSVRSPRAGTLEVADMTAPGWRASVNGMPAGESLEVGTVRRVEIPVGESVVEWNYAPRSYAVGVYLTAAGLGIALFGMIAGFGAGASRRMKELAKA